MSHDQGERIKIVLAYPREGRDVRALVIEDNLVGHGWRSTRMELHSDQLRGYKLGLKKSKIVAEDPTEVKVAASPKKATSSRLPKRKTAASSSNRPASAKFTAPPPPTVKAVDEEEALLENLKRKKRSRTESRSTLEVALPSQTGIPPESENSQTPLEAPLMMTPEGVSFGEAARQALNATEEILREGHLSARLLP